MTAFVSAARRPRSFPLELKLPLLVITLLSAALAGALGVSYLEVQRALLHSARSRVQHAARALATTLERDADARLRRMRDIAADAGLVMYLSGGVRTEWEARAVLDRLTDSADSLALAVILSRDGSPLLWSDQDTEPAAAVPDELGAAIAAAPAAGGYGPVFWKAAQASTWATVPVTSAHEQIGWVAQLHVLDTELQGLRVDSTVAVPSVRLASTPGELWSTLSGEPTPAPAVWPFSGARGYERSTGERQLAYAAEIAGTAWTVVVEVSEDVVLAPVRRFVGRVAAVAAGILLIAAVAAWLLGRGFTRSIRRLRVATQTIAAGDNGEQVVLRRGSELGALAAALNAAITQVRARRRELEVQHGEARELAAELLRENTALEERLTVETADRVQVAEDGHVPLEHRASVGGDTGTPVPFEPRVALLEVAVATVLDTLRPQAEEKGIVITDTCGCDSTTFYFGDPKHVEPMIMNLVTQAMNSTPAPGRIHIECRTSPADETPSSQVIIASMTVEGARIVLHLPPAARHVDSAAIHSTVQ